MESIGYNNNVDTLTECGWVEDTPSASAPKSYGN